MKKILPLFLFIIVIKAYANDPNFDTSSGIIDFPRITVNNNERYKNVQLRLNTNGTWDILRAEPEIEPLNLSGNWNGTANSSSYPGCTGQISGSLTQNGNELTGSGILNGNCVGSGSGDVVGSINGNNISFGIAFNNNTSIHFDGTISSDYRTLSGSYTWPSNNDRGTWSLSLQ